MFRVISVPAADADCIAVRRGRDVVVCVADRLLSPRGAAAIAAALAQLTAQPTVGNSNREELVP